jgi:hypothetical protein
MSVIVKCGDDLRQEMMVYQVLKQLQVNSFTKTCFSPFLKLVVLVCFIKSCCFSQEKQGRGSRENPSNVLQSASLNFHFLSKEDNCLEI